jgi:lysozyme family protein
MTTPTSNLAARFILLCEARRDTKDADHDGNTAELVVYKLPRSDGGGTYEIAGINDRFHPDLAAKLKRLLDDNKDVEAEEAAVNYIAEFTNAAGWSSIPAIEVFLRDCCFNRGPRGAARILQLALGVADDGTVGPKTRGALQKVEATVQSQQKFIVALRQARETYERKVAPPIGERAKFWKGLVNRWDSAANYAESLV